MRALYNDIEPYSIKLLNQHIKSGHLPDGEVTNEDIRDLCKTDLSKYGQVHLFAGIGGFPLACRMAGLPDDFKIITGGFPCQPFSSAGARRGVNDNRYLWPQTLAALKSHRPDVAIFENVAGLASVVFPREGTLMAIKDLIGRAREYRYRRKEYGVLNQICEDIEQAGYSVTPIVIPACSVGAHHKRDRIWLTCVSNAYADRARARVEKHRGGGQKWKDSSTPKYCHNVSHSSSSGRERQGQSIKSVGAKTGENRKATQFSNGGERCEWKPEPSVGRVVNGLPARVDRIKGLGNAIVPQVAAELIRFLVLAFDIEVVEHGFA